MISTDEQEEAARVAEARKHFPKFKWIGVLARREWKLRLFRIVWMRGMGPGWGYPENYSAMFSLGVQFKRQDCWTGVFWRTDHAEVRVWVCLVPLLPICLHYQRSYSGWHESPGPSPRSRRPWWKPIQVV